MGSLRSSGLLSDAVGNVYETDSKTLLKTCPCPHVAAPAIIALPSEQLREVFMRSKMARIVVIMIGTLDRMRARGDARRFAPHVKRHPRSARPKDAIWSLLLVYDISPLAIRRYFGTPGFCLHPGRYFRNG